MTLLFIEDDPDDVMLIEHACKKVGITAPKQFFPNARRAIEFLEQQLSLPGAAPFSHAYLIFLDLNMPGMSGFDFVHWLRSNPALRTTPVIILSTSENPRDVRRAYELGANAYLVKPSTVNDLFQMLSAANTFWLTYNRFDSGMNSSGAG